MTTEEQKQFLNQEAQILKDKFIDRTLKMDEDFRTDWQRIMGRIAQLDQEDKKEDKLN